MGKANGFLKQKLGNWAKSIGVEGTLNELVDKPKPFAWDFAKFIVYKNIKKALGLDEARFVTYGAAPLNQATRDYFASLNLFLVNTYGMSESAGPFSYWNPGTGTAPNLKSCGLATPGCDFIIDKPDKDGNGEICFRGRNRFMGYLNDVNNTKKTIDNIGNLHTGDIGNLDKEKHLYITGRLKELIITAGGENVAPVIIESEIKNALPEISQAVVIGENRKYLSVLLTLKHTQVKVGQPGEDIEPNTLKDLHEKGIKGKNAKEIIADPKFQKYIEDGIAAANKKATSRA
eukprot:CAMPEP_0114580138 /NCGR_PEP_ID=MMETSP0125-20121206/4476_1 /TAXON_ID=485358 ORGANISM="Aristerostoma sp., Strain ATCC 50986" /NCGR_SAMPLE_ID=MMETSP0125 /ASSEMBLY_ACC=CAM_ASM_000245 /LENGTH=288 /DNA_ID=CAMNT_0001771505 /DNA_START=207 /DNA_END=1073 /DNA_ORIENTATION=-